MRHYTSRIGILWVETSLLTLLDAFCNENG